MQYHYIGCIYIYTNLSIYLSVCLSVYLSIYLSLHIYIYIICIYRIPMSIFSNILEHKKKHQGPGKVGTAGKKKVPHCIHSLIISFPTLQEIHIDPDIRAWKTGCHFFLFFFMFFLFSGSMSIKGNFGHATFWDKRMSRTPINALKHLKPSWTGMSQPLSVISSGSNFHYVSSFNCSFNHPIPLARGLQSKNLRPPQVGINLGI